MTDASGLTAEEQAELRKIAVEEGITDTSMPKMETDAEPPIALLPLLNQHSKLIEALRAACQAELNSDPDPQMKTHYNDNLFLLRFLLSAKFKLDKATHAVKTAIAWRNKHRGTLAAIRAGGPIPGWKDLHAFDVADFHKTTIDGAPVLIIRAGVSDVSAAIEHMDHVLIHSAFVFSKEVAYLQCDEESRKHGHFVKMISILDMANASLFSTLDRRWMKVMGEAVKEMELCYPQLLGANVIMNAPGWMRMGFSLAAKFLPESTMEKVVVDSNKVPTYEAKRRAVDLAKNPYAWARFIRAENIPTFLGGTCACNRSEQYPHGRCICGIDNNRTIPVTQAPYPEER